MNAIALVIWLLTGMLSLVNPAVQDLDKTGTTAISRNNFGSQLFENKHVTSRQVFQAERTGFEPVERFYTVHRFSKPAHSTTLPSLLRKAKVYTLFRFLSTGPASLFPGMAYG